MIMIEEKSLKRLIRAMNSVLNLYDVEDIPEAIVDVMMHGVVKVANILKLSEIAIYDNDGVMVKYVMPENFDTWLQTEGETTDAESTTEETG